MKKFNALDITIVAAAIAIAVILGVLFARISFGDTVQAQITLNMTEDTDAAKYIKIGDSVWLEDDALLGSVASIKSLESGGIAITVNASVTAKDGTKSVNGIVLKLGKTYRFHTKRVLGIAVCDSISGERR